jgi:hypothetical protein
LTEFVFRHPDVAFSSFDLWRLRKCNDVEDDSNQYAWGVVEVFPLGVERMGNSVLKKLSTGRAAVLVTLVGSVIAGVLPATASAQPGSRLCGVMLRRVSSSGPGPDYYLYLGEADSESQENPVASGYQLCDHVKSAKQNGYWAETYDNYAKCEDVSKLIGWSDFTGNPSGYDKNDICNSMNRGWGYKLEITGGNPLKVTSFAQYDCGWACPYPARVGTPGVSGLELADG